MANNIAHIFPVSLPLKQTRVLKMIDVQSEINNGDIYFFSRSRIEKDITKYKSSFIYEIKSLSTNNIFTKILSNLIWTTKIFFQIKKKKISIICCHSLTTLPLCAFYKKLYPKTKLIYEPHEHETETINLGFLRKKISKIIEKRLIKCCNNIIFVTQAILKAYEKDYAIKRDKCLVISNATNLKYKGKEKNQYLKKHYGIKKNEILFIYIGIFSKARKILQLLEIFKKNAKKHVVFIGYGDLVSEIRESSENFNNIHMQDPIEPNLITDYISAADVGLSLLEDNLNHRLTMPNKIFQYLNSNIPVIVNTNVECINIVKEFDCGWIVNNEISKIKTLIENITLDDISKKCLNVEKVLNRYNWNNEKMKLTKFYTDILK